MFTLNLYAIEMMGFLSSATTGIEALASNFKLGHIFNEMKLPGSLINHQVLT